jgi:hypothetical protein
VQTSSFAAADVLHTSTHCLYNIGVAFMLRFSLLSHADLVKLNMSVKVIEARENLQGKVAY